MIDSLKDNQNVQGYKEVCTELNHQDALYHSDQNSSTQPNIQNKSSVSDNIDQVNRLKAIHSILHKFEVKSKLDEEALSNIDEWQSVALVVDRLCFLIMFSINVIIACTIFINGYVRTTADLDA